MNYCVGCKLASPTGAAFCTSCGKGFGYTCQCGSRNETSAKFCATCGRENTVEVTRYVPVGWISRIAKVGVLIGCAVLLLTHFGLIAEVCSDCFSRALAVFLCDRTVRRLSDMTFAWIVTILAFSLILPEPSGSSVRRWLGTTLGQALRHICLFAWGAFVWFCQTIMRCLNE